MHIIANVSSLPPFFQFFDHSHFISIYLFSNKIRIPTNVAFTIRSKDVVFDAQSKVCVCVWQKGGGGVWCNASITSENYVIHHALPLWKRQTLADILNDIDALVLRSTCIQSVWYFKWHVVLAHTTHTLAHFYLSIWKLDWKAILQSLTENYSTR